MKRTSDEYLICHGVIGSASLAPVLLLAQSSRCGGWYTWEGDLAFEPIVSKCRSPSPKLPCSSEPPGPYLFHRIICFVGLLTCHTHPCCSGLAITGNVWQGTARSTSTPSTSTPSLSSWTQPKQTGSRLPLAREGPQRLRLLTARGSPRRQTCPMFIVAVQTRRRASFHREWNHLVKSKSGSLCGTERK